MATFNKRVKRAGPQPTLAERFAGCCEEFQEKIRGTAAKHGKTWEQVYGWWREYSESCQSSDQSAVYPEFLDWYKAKLEG